MLYDREGTRRDGRPDVSSSCRRRSACAASRSRASRSSRTRPPTSTAATVLWLGPDEWLVLGATEDDYPGRGGRGRRLGQPRRVRARRARTRPTCSHRAARSTSTVGAGRLRADAARARAGDPLPADADTFRILVRPSFADYLRAWLRDATSGDL